MKFNESFGVDLPSTSIKKKLDIELTPGIRLDFKGVKK